MTAKSDEPLSIIRQLELMRNLQRLANDRWEEEVRIEGAFEEGLRAAEQTRDATGREIETRYTANRQAAQEEYEAKNASAETKYQADRDAAQREYKGLRSDVESEHSRVLRAALTEQQETSWETLAVFDAIKGRPKERLLAAMRRLRDSSAQLAVLERDAEAIMRMRRQWREVPAVGDGTEAGSAVVNGEDRGAIGRLNDQSVGDAAEGELAKVEQRTSAVREAAQALYEQRMPRLFEGGNLVGVFFAAWAVAVVPCGFALGWENWWWIAVSFVLAIGITGGVAAWLYPRARKQSGEQFQVVRHALADARQAINQAMDAAQQRGRREAESLLSLRDRELATVEQKLHSTLHEKDRWKDAEMNSAGSVFPSRLAQQRHELQTALSAAESQYNQSLAQLAEQRDAQTAESRQRYEASCAALRSEHDRAWEVMAEQWLAGYETLRGSWGNIQGQCERLFPNWEVTNEATWPRPAETPTALSFGQVTLDLANVKHGLPQDERLRPPRTFRCRR